MNNIQQLLDEHRAKALAIVDGYLEGFAKSSYEKSEGSLGSYRAQVENTMYTQISLDLMATIEKMSPSPSDEDLKKGPIIMEEARNSWFAGLAQLRNQILAGHLA